MRFAIRQVINATTMRSLRELIDADGYADVAKRIGITKRQLFAVMQKSEATPQHAAKIHAFFAGEKQ